MGVFVRGITGAAKQGIGWPNPGWPPPPGYAGRSITDILVNQDTAMTVGAFHAGVRLIAEDIASLPLILYRRLKPAGKERAADHPSFAMLHDAANPDMTAMVWRETMVGHVLTWGNCYSEKEFNGLGQVVRMWPLRPDRMDVRRDPLTDRRKYDYRLPSGEVVTLPASKVFHVPGFGFDGLIGYSRITMARRALENAIAIEEYGLYTFANGASPGTVIRHPQQLSNTAKGNIKRSWDEQHSGLSNAQRTAILDEGMELETIGFTPEDAQFLASKQHTTEEVARWLRLSPHKLSDLSRATFSNIEESNIDHVVSTLRPIAKRFEQQLGKDVIEDPAYFAEHLFEGLLVGKTLERYQSYQIARMSGWLNADEIRDRENMNPLPNGEGEVYLAPLNMTPVDLLAQAVIDRTAAAGKEAEAGLEIARSQREANVVLAAAVERPVAVTFAEGAIKTDVHAPITIAEGAVQNTIAEGAIRSETPITVNTPETHIDVAAAPLPVAPVPVTTRKTVERDGTGRITAIVEEPA